MNKINGYTAEEASSLVKFVCAGKMKGKTLTRIFEEYAADTGRAKGSVRNYYYALLKRAGDRDVKKVLKGTDLKAGRIQPFTDEETDRILRAILEQKSRGVSVRRAVLNLAGGAISILFSPIATFAPSALRQFAVASMSLLLCFFF